MWYTVEDVIASKILTGKNPDIIEAITFRAHGQQKNLKPVSISGIQIKPEDDFIKTLIEERMKVKKSNRPDKDQIQFILKIIANATSYGIFVQIDVSDKDKSSQSDIYSIESFKTQTDKIEKPGDYFNPVMAVLITASAHLIPGIAETLVKQNNGYIAYMDTDSIFVNPKSKALIQSFFKPLCPYNPKVEMFKVEDTEISIHDPETNKDRAEKISLENVMFYGISTKRFCLYRYNENNKLEILKPSDHGLGQYLGLNGKKLDEHLVWDSILRKDYSCFSEMKAVSQLTITKPSILKYFKNLNNNKPISKQIKPFNFITIGNEVNGIIRTLPFTKDLNGIQFREFVDYRTGKSSKELQLSSNNYWKSLDDVLTEYIKHNNNKFNYIEGIAHRKHIVANRIRYIGKESNNIDEVNVFGIDDDTYLEYENHEAFLQWILTLRPNEAKKLGISKRGLRNFKQKIRNGNGLKNRSKIFKILFENYLESDKVE